MERALQQALARWRTCRCEQLALNIDSLHEHLLRSAWLPPIQPELARPQTARRELVSPKSELTSLIISLPSPSSPRFGAHLDAMRAFPPDPRVAQALRTALEFEEGLAAPKFRTVWRRVFATLASIGDPRARGWLPPLAQAQRAGTTASRRWLLAGTAELCGALPVGQPSNVAPIDLPPVKPLESLSDEERLVTADWLSSYGDPRGEFLVLQHKRELLPLERQREGELVRKWARSWLGPLARAIRTDGLRFEKGVVVECRLSGDRAAEFTNHSTWRSVRSLDLRSLQWNVSLPRVTAFLAAPAMAALRDVRGMSTAILAAVIGQRMPWRLESLEVLGYGALEPQLLEWMPWFSQLKEYVMNGQRWRREPTGWKS